jgi:hypothetical protein
VNRQRQNGGGVISVNSEAKQGAISVNMERQRGEGGSIYVNRERPKRGAIDFCEGGDFC